MFDTFPSLFPRVQEGFGARGLNAFGKREKFLSLIPGATVRKDSTKIIDSQCFSSLPTNVGIEKKFLIRLRFQKKHNLRQK